MTDLVRESAPYILTNIEGGAVPSLTVRRMSVDQAAAANDQERSKDSPLRWLPCEFRQTSSIAV